MIVIVVLIVSEAIGVLNAEAGMGKMYENMILSMLKQITSYREKNGFV